MQFGTSISVFHVRSATAESTGISRPAYAVYQIYNKNINSIRHNRRFIDFLLLDKMHNVCNFGNNEYLGKHIILENLGPKFRKSLKA